MRNIERRLDFDCPNRARNKPKNEVFSVNFITFTGNFFYFVHFLTRSWLNLDEKNRAHCLDNLLELKRLKIERCLRGLVEILALANFQIRMIPKFRDLCGPFSRHYNKNKRKIILNEICYAKELSQKF